MSTRLLLMSVCSAGVAGAVEPVVTSELGLLLDTSGSVTAEDFSARNAGLAGALQNPWVLSAIGSSPRSLALGVYQFSGPAQVAESVPWTTIDDVASAQSVGAALEAMGRAYAGGSDVDSALLIASILASGNGVAGESAPFVVLGDGPTAATGIGRDAALGGGVDSISAWVTGDPGDLAGYVDGVIGGTGGEALLLGGPDEYGPTFGRYLFQFFQNPDNTSTAAQAGLGQALFGTSRSAFADMNQRRSRFRRVPDAGSVASAHVKELTGAKAVLEPVPEPVRWSVFGDLRGGHQRGSARYASVFGLPVLAQAAHELSYEAASAGVESALPGGWFAGAAVVAQQADIDLGAVGDADDDAAGLAIYLSHERSLPWGFSGYADVMAGWLDHRVEINRRVSSGIGRGKTDADACLVEATVGLQRMDLGIEHGPELGLSWMRGGVDAFREAGAATAFHPATDFSSTLLELGYHAGLAVDLGKVPCVFSAGTAWEHEFEDSTLTSRGADLGSLGEDTWVIGLGAQAALSEQVILRADFENRLAHHADSQWFRLGCEVRF